MVLDPSIENASVRAELEKMAAVFPSKEPKNVDIIGAYTSTSTTNDVTVYNLTFEYEFSNAWLLSNVVLKRHDAKITILGLHVNLLPQSLKELNKFTFVGKSILHYIILAFVIIIPLFIIFMLVLCFRTHIKRKWLWLLFIAFGLVQLSFNWTDGGYGIKPISFLLFGAGFFGGGPYGPVILYIAFPLGAVIFLFKRKSLKVLNPE